MLKVLLHETIRHDDFLRNITLQCWNNVATICINVAKMLQLKMMLHGTIRNDDFFAQHSVTILEQCCNHSKQCCNPVLR